MCSGPAPVLVPGPFLLFQWVNEQAGPGPRLNCAVILPKAPPTHWLPSFFSVTSRKAKAVYSCEAEHDSELSFQVGAIFNAGKCYRLHQLFTQNQPRHIGFGAKPNTQSGLQSNREMRQREGGMEGEAGDLDLLLSVWRRNSSFNDSQRKRACCSFNPNPFLDTIETPCMNLLVILVLPSHLVLFLMNRHLRNASLWFKGLSLILIIFWWWKVMLVSCVSHLDLRNIQGLLEAVSLWHKCPLGR